MKQPERDPIHGYLIDKVRAQLADAGLEVEHIAVHDTMLMRRESMRPEPALEVQAYLPRHWFHLHPGQSLRCLVSERETQNCSVADAIVVLLLQDAARHGIVLDKLNPALGDRE